MPLSRREGRCDLMAQAAKRQKMNCEPFPLFLLPNEIKSQIIRCLSLMDRKRLGSTCKLMYKLENDAGGYEFDKAIAIQPGHSLEFVVIPAFHHRKKLLNIPSKMKDQIFKHARIRHLDFTHCYSLPCTSLPDFLETASYNNISAHKYWTYSSDSRTLVNNLVKVDNFKRGSIFLRWVAEEIDAHEDRLFLRGLPPASKLKLRINRYDGDSEHSDDMIDRATLLDIVANFDYCEIDCTIDDCTTASRRLSGNIICGSEKSRTFEMKCSKTLFEELISLLGKSITRFNNKSRLFEGRSRSGALITGTKYVLPGLVQFTMSNIA